MFSHQRSQTAQTPRGHEGWTNHRLRMFHIFAHIAVAVTCLSTAVAVSAGTPFYHEIADIQGESAQYTSLVITPDGIDHIAYYDRTSGLVKYVVRSGAGWTIETVEDMGASRDYAGTSLAIDAQGTPHISYYEDVGGDLHYATKVNGTWMVELVETTDDVGRYSSIALDPDGDPHISYYDVTNGELWYAEKENGTWSTQMLVGVLNDEGKFSSLAIDAFGNSHVAYFDETSDDLWYAVRVQGSWTFELVAGPGSVGQDAALALDPQGNPHIAYYDSDNDDTRYASKVGSSWSTELASTDGIFVDGEASLAIDELGNPHITHRSIDLLYTVKKNAAWTTEIVTATGTVGFYPSIAVDPQGNPAISYMEFNSGDLRIADSAIHLTSPVGAEEWVRGGEAVVTWKGAGQVFIFASADGGETYVPLAQSVSGGSATVSVPAWTTDEARVEVLRSDPLSISDSPGTFTVSPRPVSPWWAEIVAASGNSGTYSSVYNAEVIYTITNCAYRDETNGTMRFTYRLEDGWDDQLVDDTADVGLWCSAAPDNLGNAHISYYDNTNGDLKYATNSGGSWLIESVDTGGDVGLFTSIAVDGDGVPRISYRDETNGDLKYADRSGGSWSTEIAEATGDVGIYTSLALAGENVPHIAYQDVGNGTLKFARKIGGVWETETVDASSSSIGVDASLALDSDGNVHISYIDNIDFELIYARATPDPAGGSSVWQTELVDEFNASAYASLAVDSRGRPHISYNDGINGDLRYATKVGGTWYRETLEGNSAVGEVTSIALDADDNPHIVHYDAVNQDLRIVSGGVQLTAPTGDDVWPVGATRAVQWEGGGDVDISLSVDGGNSYTTLATGVSGGAYQMIVPHTPSKFCVVRLEREQVVHEVGHTFVVDRHSSSQNSAFFTIETDISLLMLIASLPPQGNGLIVSWQTDPGPADLRGYRLEKAIGDVFQTLVAETKETRYHDTNGRRGDTYRLFAINGLGEELLLGETESDQVPGLPDGIAVYPVPYRDGDMTIDFATTMGGVPVATEVVIYDVLGRKVRTVAQGTFRGPTHRVTWDGTNDVGELVSSGMYFVRASSRFGVRTRKIAVVR